jgi:hypothetical protein
MAVVVRVVVSREVVVKVRVVAVVEKLVVVV